MGLLKKSEGYIRETIAMRGGVHMHPELGGSEKRTSMFTTSQLQSLGIPYVCYPNFGVLGVVDSHGPGKTVASRCDMNVSPVVAEETELPCVSIMEAAIKYFNENLTEPIRRAITRVATSTAGAYRVACNVCIDRHCSPVVNHEALSVPATRSVITMFTKHGPAQTQLILASDDFSVYLEHASVFLPSWVAEAGLRRSLPSAPPQVYH